MATLAVAGSRPRGTSSTILPPWTTIPRSAPSARMESGSLIQIGCVWSIIPPDLRTARFSVKAALLFRMQRPSQNGWQLALVLQDF